MNSIFSFAEAHPVKTTLYAVGGAIGLYLAVVLLLLIVCLGLALYAGYGKSKYAARLREWAVETQFINEQVKKATPAQLARHGGKRGYKKFVKGAVAGMRLTIAIKDATERIQKKSA